MKISIEDLGPCKKLLRVEVDAETVDKKFNDVTQRFKRQAKIPGFRPGKAPNHLVQQSYGHHIESDVRSTLISDAYKKAIKEQDLRPVHDPEIEEVQFGKGLSLQFIATLEIEPDFELPEYKGIPVKREIRNVDDEDVTKAIDVLREQQSTFADVERPVQVDDYVVINYKGSSDGKPLTDIAPTAQGLTEKDGFWVHIEKDSFIPGFTEQLVGANKGEQKTVTVDFPAEFVIEGLAGKPGSFEVEVVQVKEKVLPELSDGFAQQLGAESVDALVEGVRYDLENELKFKLRKDTHNQLLRSLLNRIDIELPESVVQEETRNAVYDIVRENQRRGVPKDAIDQSKDAIFTQASTSARDRVKLEFVINRIAKKEGITVTKEEFQNFIQAMANSENTTPEKLMKRIQERKALSRVYESIIRDKVLDLLELNAKVEETLPSD